MNWESFHYLCREHNIKIQNGYLNFKDVFKSTTFNLYNIKDRTNKQISNLAERISNLDNVKDQHKITEVYALLDFSETCSTPRKVKHIQNYLLLLSVCFFFMSAVYIVFVFPKLDEAFINFDLIPQGSSTSFIKYYPAGWNLILGLLLISYYLSRELKLIANWEIEANRFSLKYLFPKKLKGFFTSLDSIITFPISCKEVGFDDLLLKSEIVKHLSTFTNANQLTVEIAQLSKIYSYQLTRYCERFMYGLLSMISILIISAIFHFLYSAYMPIFSLGEIV